MHVTNVKHYMLDEIEKQWVGSLFWLKGSKYKTILIHPTYVKISVVNKFDGWSVSLVFVYHFHFLILNISLLLYSHMTVCMC
jgi:hypothetical protein